SRFTTSAMASQNFRSLLITARYVSPPAKASPAMASQPTPTIPLRRRIIATPDGSGNVAAPVFGRIVVSSRGMSRVQDLADLPHQPIRRKGFLNERDIGRQHAVPPDLV